MVAGHFLVSPLWVSECIKAPLIMWRGGVMGGGLIECLHWELGVKILLLASNRSLLQTS